MQLFASMPEAQAEQAARGTLRDDVVWLDAADPDAASDLVWMTIDLPDVRMARYEIDADGQRRRFLIPARVSNLHGAQRVAISGERQSGRG